MIDGNSQTRGSNPRKGYLFLCRRSFEMNSNSLFCVENLISLFMRRVRLGGYGGGLLMQLVVADTDARTISMTRLLI